MTREEAKQIISDIDKAYRNFTADEYEALEMAIKALENHDTFMKYAYSQGKQDALSQEPCDDAISRDAAIKTVHKMRVVCDTEDIDDYYELLVESFKQLPSVTQKSGKWILQPSNKEQGERDFIWWECSKCGQVIYSETEHDRKEYHAFCGRCGADMRGDNNE